MDFYTQFRLILSKWIGFVGTILGNDILRKDFKITVHTVFFLIIAITGPIFYVWTFCMAETELAIKAMGVFVTACMVS